MRADAASGEVRARRRLPSPIGNVKYLTHYPVHPVAEGFFLHDGERLYFVDWEGRAKRLT